MSVWFITGCSSGFGIGLARLALQNGHHVIATSRTPSKTPLLVSEIEKLGGTWLQLDVCAPSLHDVLDRALSIHGHIDVLVNNAGSSTIGPVEDISDAEARALMDINFFAPLNIIRHVLPGMRKRRQGTIVNVSSTQGQIAVPCTGIYAASKHALEGMSEALAYEVSPLGIRVLIIEPGGFNTSFASSVQLPSAPLTADYADGPVAAVLNAMPGMVGKQFGDPEKGCRAIYDVVMRTGVAQGLEREFLRYPLGSDCVARLKGKVKALGETLDGTRRVWESTDVVWAEGEERMMLNFKA